MYSNAPFVCKYISQSQQWAFSFKSHSRHAPSNEVFKSEAKIRVENDHLYINDDGLQCIAWAFNYEHLQTISHMKYACSWERLFLRWWHALQTRPQRCCIQIEKRWVRWYLPMSLSSLTSSSCWSCCRMRALSTQHSVTKHRVIHV